MIILQPILTTSLIHFSLEGWENVPFELGSEKVSSTSETGECLQCPCTIKLNFICKDQRKNIFLIHGPPVFHPWLESCTDKRSAFTRPLGSALQLIFPSYGPPPFVAVTLLINSVRI